jgi:hypothetical protein
MPRGEKSCTDGNQTQTVQPIAIHILPLILRSVSHTMNNPALTNEGNSTR